MERIGRYRIVERLGQGGMGVVYKAFDPQIERTVAIKVISGHRFDDPELRERFFREAKAAGGLAHPNIVVVYDLGEEQGQPYIAMEYVEGHTLDTLMQSKAPFPMALRLAIILDVCRGLGYAHERGIIHRDIKPGNIMVTPAGSAKILDFGLARLISSDLTRSNLMLGTMNYMAPEQLRGQGIDQRVDIFAVGVVMYELFGGRRPFEGDSLASAIYKVLEEDPPPLQDCNPSAPPELAAIVARALAKDRDQRYLRMEALEQDLLAFHAEHGDRLAEAEPPTDGQAGAEFAPTMLQETIPPALRRTTPLPRSTPTPTRRTPTPSAQPAGRTPSTPDATIGPTWLKPAGIAAAVLAVALVAAVLVWRGREGSEPETASSAETQAQPASKSPDVQPYLDRGRKALGDDDYDTAIREAQAALSLAPGAAEAKKLLDEAEALQSRVETGTREAQRLYDAGRLKEAERAATAVLGLAPNNPHAQELIAKLAENARRETADEAMQHVENARRQAEKDGARTLARAMFQRAERVEGEARRQYAAGQYAAATARLYESSGLYSTAAGEARRQAALRQQRQAEAEAKRAADALQTRLDDARREYERRRQAALLAGADRRAPERFQAATRQAVAAEERSDARAVDEYLRAAAGMTEARTLALEAAERERVAAERERDAKPAPPPAAAPAVTPPPAVSAPQAPPEPPAEEGIRAALAQYIAALEARDMGALKRVWPTLSGAQEEGIRADFQNAREIDVEIQNERVEISGDSATVTCVRRYRLQTRDGHRLATDNRTIITLGRTGRSWNIQSMRFEAP